MKIYDWEKQLIDKFGHNAALIDFIWEIIEKETDGASSRTKGDYYIYRDGYREGERDQLKRLFYKINQVASPQVSKEWIKELLLEKWTRRL